MAHMSFPQAAEERDLWLSRYVAFAVSSGVDPGDARNAALAIGSKLPLLWVRRRRGPGLGRFYGALAAPAGLEPRGWVAYLSDGGPALRLECGRLILARWEKARCKALTTPDPPGPRSNDAGWRDTAATLQLWTQIVGKVRLALSPWLNHGWQVPLYVNTRGIGTSPIHVDGRLCEIDFDLVDHRLVVRTSDAPARGFALEPMSVATFHRRFMAELDAAGIRVTINLMPNEVPDPIRFPDDQVHASYDAEAVNTYWRALVRSGLAPFDCSAAPSWARRARPISFWGAFDLAVTRFSGRTAPLHPGGVPGLPDAVTCEAYSHEVSSAGFWPGDARYPHAAFYSYAYPMPPGFAQAKVEPAQAVWSADMGEWLLPYDAVRTAADPDAVLARFLETTYRAAADLGAWDRSLECGVGVPGRPRPVHGAS